MRAPFLFNIHGLLWKCVINVDNLIDSFGWLIIYCNVYFDGSIQTFTA